MTKKLTKREQGMLDKIEELTNDVQRNQAEFENFRRRSEEEQRQSVGIGKRAAIVELVPIIDNLDRAMGQIPAELADHQYIKGMKGILKQLHDALDKFGLEKIPTVGNEFNPETMSAALMEDGDGDTEVVLEELQAGYMLNGEVVRHAMVKVGKK
jgi:molecular chaperone GrpE